MLLRCLHPGVGLLGPPGVTSGKVELAQLTVRSGCDRVSVPVGLGTVRFRHRAVPVLVNRHGGSMA